jgi:hypothetical protein
VVDILDLAWDQVTEVVGDLIPRQVENIYHEFQRSAYHPQEWVHISAQQYPRQQDADKETFETWCRGVKLGE